MDTQTQLLISSVIINILLVIERTLARVKRSQCCGNTVEMKNENELKTSKTTQDLNKNDIELNIQK